MTATQRIDQLIEGFDTAMLVTRSLEHKPRARPMAIAGHSEGAQLYFATRLQDEKLDEILRAPDVAVTLQGGDHFLSVTGRASLETDKQLAEKLWNTAMKVWFPDGPGDPELALIVVNPDYAEYWDRSGWRKLEFYWEAGKALLKGEPVEDSKLSGNAKVRRPA